MSICVRLFPANTLITLQRLHSLAFGFKNFCLIAKDQASLPHDGLLERTRHHALMTYPGLIYRKRLPAILLIVPKKEVKRSNPVSTRRIPKIFIE